MAEKPVKAGHKKCGSCRVVKPISEFWKRGTGGEERRKSCAECLKKKSKRILENKLADPLVKTVIDLLQNHGPMTIDEMAEFITDKTLFFLGYQLKRMRQNGLLDRALFADTRKNAIWHLPGQSVSEEAELEKAHQFKLDGRIDFSAISVERASYPRGIDKNDLEWMQKYRQRAALKRIPGPERARFEYTA